MLFAPKEKGQGLVEYALILVLLAIVVVAAFAIFKPFIGEHGYGIVRFIARYWPFALIVFLADLCARLIMDKLNQR